MDRCLRIKSTDKTEKKSIFPDRCTINPLNNDLIVSGYESGCKGVVVNFNPEGKLIFTYKEERPFIPFTPRGLTCSPNGNILICNEYNGDVTILDSRLQLIRVIDTVCLNISEKPRGVWWDKVGHLILGTITSENGRIHIADYSDKN
jgi:streptogramin lyase